MMMNNDISGLRNSVDRQVTDLMHINNEMKSRPVVDPSKISSANSQLDAKLRDMHNQVMDLQKNLNREQRDREKETKTANDGIQRLQDMIRQQDMARQDIMNNLSKKGDVDKVPSYVNL